MAHLENLVQWGKRNGIVLRGVQPADIPGRGIGMIATRSIKAGETILEAPHQVVRCLDTIPQDVRQRLPDNMSIHGLIAATLILETDPSNQWKANLPSMADLEAGVPALWPGELQDLLPPGAGGIFKAQMANLTRDWERFRVAFPDVREGEFRHAWFLANSRSFLDQTDGVERRPWEDRLAMVPLADLFNHSTVAGCKMTHTPRKGYSVTARTNHRRGEEVFISYGDHTNDFMLVEYGFILDRNPWDEVLLDHVILPRLSGEQKAELQRRNLLGKYPLSPSAELHHRTQAVLHLLTTPASVAEWALFTDRKGVKSREDRRAIRSYTVDLLEGFMDEIQAALGRLERLGVGREAQRGLLRGRWEQIGEAVRARIDELAQGK